MRASSFASLFRASDLAFVTPVRTAATISSSHLDIVLASVSSSGTSSFWAHQSLKQATDPGRPASDFKAGVEKRAGEAYSPGNTEFPVKLVHVVVNSGRAEEHLGGNVSVGGSVDGQPGDLSFLRGQLPTGLVGAFHGVLAGGGQLGAGSLGEAAGAHSLKALQGRAELVAGVAPTPLAAQPLPVDQARAG